MRLLAAGDFHQDEALAEAFIEEANSGAYDVVIAVGDFEDEGYYQEIEDAMEVPFLALTGNWDFGFEPPGNEEYEWLFNYQQIEFDDYKIVLVGSIYPDDLKARVHDFFGETPRERCIIASHYPPHMLGDLARTGTRAGFPQFRELIMREKPALWLCGHIHEDFGEFSLMQTTVLNAASRETGKGWAVELGDDGVEETEEVVLTDDR